MHEDAIGGYDDFSDFYLDVGTLESCRASAGLSDAQWSENETDLRREARKARRDQIKELLNRLEAIEGYSFAPPAQSVMPEPDKATQRPSSSLRDVLEDFMAEYSPQWSDQMEKKARGFLAVMLEFCDPDRPFAGITRKDEAELKKVILALPANRNIKPETKGLPLLEAVQVVGVKKISVQTFNDHMAMFDRLSRWFRDTLLPGLDMKEPGLVFHRQRCHKVEHTYASAHLPVPPCHGVWYFR